MVYRSGSRWTTMQRLEKDLPVSFEPEDGNKMSLHRSKRTLRNGFSHHSSLSLATLERQAQLVVAGQSCQSGSSTLRWGKCQKLRHNSASVRDRLRECGFVNSLHQSQTPLPMRKCALELPTQFTGQRNYGVPVCMVDQQSGSVREPQPSGQAEANQHTFGKLKSNCSLNLEPSSMDRIKQKSMGHVAEDSGGPGSMQVIFSTEVPQHATLDRRRGHSESVGTKGENLKNLSDAKGQGPSGETYTFSSKKTQRVLQDQIRRVVINLEEVLHGLKEVHLEMKEVVQQIDQLTSNIDLGEVDANDTSGGSSSSKRTPVSEDGSEHTDNGAHMVRDTSGHQTSPSTVPRVNKKFQASSADQPQRGNASRLPPPAYQTLQTGTKSLALKSNHGASQSKGVAKGPRSQKPPPYPFIRRTSKGKDPGLKAPPYSGRQKLLSTTV